MNFSYTHVADLAKAVEPPADGILTRTLLNDEHVKVVMFGFGKNEELSEHTSSLPAMLHFLQGEATLTLEENDVSAQPGTWVHMPPGMRHSIRAHTPAVMSLVLIKER